jgi:g-D-glutamyl-meso-diaminopimelate peptidase
VIYDEVKKFYRDYQQKKCIIGYSCHGKEIFAFHVGKETGRQFIAVYAVHAREWITTRLALKHIKARVSCGGWIIPLLNPDGAVISETTFPLWKANVRGVDLNCNFDADWGSGRLNTHVRGGENCIGDFPFSEPETMALRDFTLKIRPFVTLSFHTKGEEIYWEYGGKGDIRGAKIISDVTGYEIKRIFGSAGGYKDWCIQKLKIPAYTIECGSDNLAHPITDIKKLKKCFKLLKIFTENYGR